MLGLIIKFENNETIICQKLKSKPAYIRNRSQQQSYAIIKQVVISLDVYSLTHEGMRLKYKEQCCQKVNAYCSFSLVIVMGVGSFV